MKENNLIKYNGGQLEKVKNVIAITDKLLEPVSKEEQDLISQNLQKQDAKIIAAMAIKKLLTRAKKHKAIQDYLNMDEQMHERDKQ